MVGNDDSPPSTPSPAFSSYQPSFAMCILLLRALCLPPSSPPTPHSTDLINYIDNLLNNAQLVTVYAILVNDSLLGTLNSLSSIFTSSMIPLPLPHQLHCMTHSFTLEGPDILAVTIISDNHLTPTCPWNQQDAVICYY